MRNRDRWIVALLFAACLQLSGCERVAETEEGDEEVRSAVVEHLEGAEPTRVTLTADAAKRLDVQTAKVDDVEIDGAQRTVIPYAAILYDIHGGTWTYTNPEPLKYVRHPISVERIEGNLAILSDGLPAGTEVVTVGAAELYGSEIEFEEE